MLSKQPNGNRQALLTCDEMRRAEDLTCEHGPLTFFDLMRNAGRAVAETVRKTWKPCRVLVLCGPGNNGGDGYIAAETLRQAGWPVTVGAFKTGTAPPDAARAAQAWHGETKTPGADLAPQTDLVVDALFGTGLKRPLTGDIAGIIEKLNTEKIPVVAADFPSGVDGDSGQILGVATQAQITVTFFRKKLGHVLLPGAARCGKIVVADTGMEDRVLDEIGPLTMQNSPDLWLDLFPFPHPGGHKYARGHALIAGGAVMTGAARLAARAAQRTGAGLVTVAAAASAVPIYAAALESVIVRAADTVEIWKELLADAKRNVLLIGPGLGIGAAQAEFVLAALATGKPCVLDADALGNFSDKPDALLAKLHPQCVLTPHEGEFARLFGRHIDSHLGKLVRACKAAHRAGCIVLIKGADTVIAAPDGHAVVNDNAPPWTATAGAGDVLAGMILGLLAQTMPAFAATAAAVWMHGRAAANFGPGLIAEDLVDGIPAVLEGLSGQGKRV